MARHNLALCKNGPSQLLGRRGDDEHQRLISQFQTETELGGAEPPGEPLSAAGLGWNSTAGPGGGGGGAAGGGGGFHVNSSWTWVSRS